jgi:MFS transporter, PPP family, 3-phenylpropionic acid transporter
MVGIQVIVKKMSHLPGHGTTWNILNIMSTKSLSLRLSFYYLALFLIVGTFVPYLPLWMGGRGLSSEQIGLVLAVALWAKIPVGLSMTGEIDYSGKRKRSLVMIALVSLGGMIAMDYANSFVAILLVWLLVGTLLTTAMPIADSLSLLAANRSGVRYGKVRRWGSISFIVASVAGGWYLQGRASDDVLWLMVGGTVLLVIATMLMPDLRTEPRGRNRPAILDVLKSPNFLLFVATAALLQSSHAGLYGFASRHWIDAGLDENTVGLLWAEGVIAEVIIFSAGGFLVAKLGPARMLMLAGLAGLVRWGVLSQTTELPVLIAIQALHGLTFSGTHIAAFAFIMQNVPEEQSASAQGLFDSLAMGLFFGLSMAAAGWVYERATSDAFLLMTALSLAGGLGATLLYWRTRKN